jgi:hypothetical protein
MKAVERMIPARLVRETEAMASVSEGSNSKKDL